MRRRCCWRHAHASCCSTVSSPQHALASCACGSSAAAGSLPPTSSAAAALYSSSSCRIWASSRLASESRPASGPSSSRRLCSSSVTVCTQPGFILQHFPSQCSEPDRCGPVCSQHLAGSTETHTTASQTQEHQQSICQIGWSRLTSSGAGAATALHLWPPRHRCRCLGCGAGLTKYCWARGSSI